MFVFKKVKPNNVQNAPNNSKNFFCLNICYNILDNKK